MKLTARPRHRTRAQELFTRAGESSAKVARHAVYPHRHQHAGAAPGQGGGGTVADGSMIGDDEALAAPLSVLGLNIRATNALLNNGFSTVGDVVAKTEPNSCGNCLALAGVP